MEPFIANLGVPTMLNIVRDACVRPCLNLAASLSYERDLFETLSNTMTHDVTKLTD